MDIRPNFSCQLFAFWSLPHNSGCTPCGNELGSGQVKYSKSKEKTFSPLSGKSRLQNVFEYPKWLLGIWMESAHEVIECFKCSKTWWCLHVEVSYACVFLSRQTNVMVVVQPEQHDQRDRWQYVPPSLVQERAALYLCCWPLPVCHFIWSKSTWVYGLFTAKAAKQRGLGNYEWGSRISGKPQVTHIQVRLIKRSLVSMIQI